MACLVALPVPYIPGQYVVNWDIPGSSLTARDGEISLVSPTIVDVPGSHWRATLEAAHVQGRDVSVFLNRHMSDAPPLRVQFTCNIVRRSAVLHSKCTELLPCGVRDRERIGWKNFFEATRPSNSGLQEMLLLKNGADPLHLQLLLSFPSLPLLSTAADRAFPLAVNTHALSDDLARLLATGEASDVSFLVLTGDRAAKTNIAPVIKAHRAILAARSPVFCAMFRSRMSETCSDAPILVEDVNAPVFRQLLHFIYTGHFDSAALQAEDAAAEKKGASPSTSTTTTITAAPVADDNNKIRPLDQEEEEVQKGATEGKEEKTKRPSDNGAAVSSCSAGERDKGLVQLLAAADKYQVCTLVTCCLNLLASTVSVHNAVARLALAAHYPCSDLFEKTCIDAISKDLIGADTLRTSGALAALPPKQLLDLLDRVAPRPKRDRAAPSAPAAAAADDDDDDDEEDKDDDDDADDGVSKRARTT